MGCSRGDTLTCRDTNEILVGGGCRYGDDIDQYHITPLDKLE